MVWPVCAKAWPVAWNAYGIRSRCTDTGLSQIKTAGVIRPFRWASSGGAARDDLVCFVVGCGSGRGIAGLFALRFLPLAVAPPCRPGHQPHFAEPACHAANHG